MSLLRYFSPQPEPHLLPRQFADPFDMEPHTLALQAAKDLQQRLLSPLQIKHDFWHASGGKMMGVLVVQDEKTKLGFLSAFSGMLGQRWMVDGFVPPVFNVKQQKEILRSGEKELASINKKIDQLKEKAIRVNLLHQINSEQQKYENDLKKVKARQLKNKKARQQQRESLQLNGDNEKILQKLSLQSQADKKELREFKQNSIEKIQGLEDSLQNEFDTTIAVLKNKRKKLSQQLHQKIFEGYRLINTQGQHFDMTSLFGNKLPPGGAGDCAGPKLLHYASLHHLRPLAMAEFWWGESPAAEIRHHGQFYPPCRSKCHIILPKMIKGLQPRSLEKKLTRISNKLVPKILYEDDSMMVLEKPAGLLSVPGKMESYSVQTWLQNNFPQLEQVQLVHRLDMATSGILLAAKTSKVHKNLQKQFIERQVSKRYVAILARPLLKVKDSIELPMRVDLDDRPRQIVCFEHGKKAVTRVQRANKKLAGNRVYFYPITGRTHQLRVHAAHKDGLNNPIVGDELYGQRAQRLMLHAESLTIKHPVNGQTMTFTSPAPF